jgi:hypothetical protein
MTITQLNHPALLSTSLHCTPLANFTHRLLPPRCPSLARIGIHTCAPARLIDGLDGEPWTSEDLLLASLTLRR